MEKNMSNNELTGNQPKKKKKKWIFIVIAVVIIILIAAGGKGNSKESTDTASKGTDVQETANNTSDDSTADKDDSASDEGSSEEEAYSVGQTWSNKSLSVNYQEAGEYTAYDSFTAPKEGYKIIYAKFELENIGSSDQYVSFADWNCYADGYACESYYYMDDPAASYAETLSAGRKCTGMIAYSVPVDAQNVEFELSANVWTSENIVFLYQ